MFKVSPKCLRALKTSFKMMIMLLCILMEKVEEEICRGEPGEGHVPPLGDGGPHHITRLSIVDTYYCIMPPN